VRGKRVAAFGGEGGVLAQHAGALAGELAGRRFLFRRRRREGGEDGRLLVEGDGRAVALLSAGRAGDIAPQATGDSDLGVAMEGARTGTEEDGGADERGDGFVPDIGGRDVGACSDDGGVATGPREHAHAGCRQVDRHGIAGGGGGVGGVRVSQGHHPPPCLKAVRW
jgi:hypothetical protein